MKNTLMQELEIKRASCQRLAIEFGEDARDEFNNGQFLLEQANRCCQREFEGKAAAYTKAIELIIKYIGISV